MRTFLVAGSPAAQKPRGISPGPGDRVVTADYGAHHALAWGWPVHLLVGDLDSLPQADIEALRSLGTPMIIAPAAKDETDLELALVEALNAGAREIVICGVLGGRVDHLLANILLLARPELASVETVMTDGNQTLCLLSSEPTAAEVSLVLSGAPGDLLTLLPLAGDAQGVSTEGLVYPLTDETLFFASARGVSNVFADGTAHVSLRRGRLLVIHISQPALVS